MIIDHLPGAGASANKAGEVLGAAEVMTLCTNLAQLVEELCPPLAEPPPHPCVVSGCVCLATGAGAPAKKLPLPGPVISI